MSLKQNTSQIHKWEILFGKTKLIIEYLIFYSICSNLNLIFRDLKYIKDNYTILILIRFHNKPKYFFFFFNKFNVWTLQWQ